MNNIRSITALGLVLCILTGTVYADTVDTSKVLVKGDGVTVTQMDLDVENLFISTKFDTTDDQKINSLLRNRLFALEAKKEWNDPLTNRKVAILIEKYYAHLYSDKIRKSLEIGDDVLKSYYIANPQEFTTPAEYNINMIMVKHKFVCEKIKKDLNKGIKDFLKAVQEDSLDEETKAKEGSMGWLTEDNLPKEMWNYVAPLEKGQISEPFMYDDNWLLLQVVDKKKSEKKEFESVKEAIREQLAQKEHMKKLDTEFKRLKKEFNVSSN